MRPDQYRILRLALGLTQSGLAEILKVTRETVNRRESGEQPITHEAALAIMSLAMPSKGTAIVNRNRSKMNALTATQRADCLKSGMQRINAKTK